MTLLIDLVSWLLSADAGGPCEKCEEHVKAAEALTKKYRITWVLCFVLTV